ncbi:hypothetical protein L3Q82_009551 [Scortum barcoo]|uniref:Uncharacterized protein n=1 Tax=Scortum barcoo TaxID=214431 RepID=A0ACB8WI10_9TELE|nr:hypothetical protein L3Q82_009551 [Scortum barcoo]
MPSPSPSTLPSPTWTRGTHIFLTGRPQAVRMGSTTSSTLTLNTGAPQGCVLSPLLYSLFTHDCVATHSSNTIIKFADDTTVIGLITMATMRWPTERRTMVERVSSFRFLGVHISEDLTWTHHTDFITKSARQQLFFLLQAVEAQHGLKDTLQLLQRWAMEVDTTCYPKLCERYWNTGASTAIRNVLSKCVIC